LTKLAADILAEKIRVCVRELLRNGRIMARDARYERKRSIAENREVIKTLHYLDFGLNYKSHSPSLALRSLTGQKRVTVFSSAAAK